MISTLRNSIGWLSDCSEIVPPLSILLPPTINGFASSTLSSSCGCSYSMHQLAVHEVAIFPLPCTSTIAVTHWSPS